jgi:hypothetical protein
VPGVLYALMIVLLAVTLATIAYSIPRAENGTEILALVLVTAVFSIVLYLIADFDAPFKGVLKLNPTGISSVERDDTAAYQSLYHTTPPCDAKGNPAQSLVNLRTSAEPATT